MPQGGVITVAARRESAERLVLSVRDTGAGMSEEVQRRALEPFFTTKGERGTGLGLAMVHGIVSRMGGTLEIASQRGAGTTVSLALPVWIEDPSAPGAIADVSPAAAHRMAVLVVTTSPGCTPDDRLLEARRPSGG